MFTSNKLSEFTTVTVNAFNMCMQHSPADLTPVLLQRSTGLQKQAVSYVSLMW